MAMLRGVGGRGPFNRDDQPGADGGLNMGGGMVPPPVEGPGVGQNDPGGNATRPIELNPGKTPTGPIGTPPKSQEPNVNAGPVDKQAFLGGGNNTMSPPSVTQNQPFMSLTAPSPESMVKSGSGLRGIGSGQVGGGLGLGAGVEQTGQQDPSSLILSLLQLLGHGGGGGGQF